MSGMCTALGADVALRMETAGAPVVVEPHFRGLRVRACACACWRNVRGWAGHDAGCTLGAAFPHSEE